MRSFGNGVELLRSPGEGKADAINYGLSRATGEILFFNDVRQTLDREALKLLAASFDDPTVGVATGELIIRSGETTEEESVGLYWRYEKWIRQRHSAIDSVPEQLGPSTLPGVTLPALCLRLRYSTMCISPCVRSSRDTGFDGSARRARTIPQPLSIQSSAEKCAHRPGSINLCGTSPPYSARATGCGFTSCRTKQAVCFCRSQ